MQCESMGMTIFTQAGQRLYRASIVHCPFELTAIISSIVLAVILQGRVHLCYCKKSGIFAMQTDIWGNQTKQLNSQCEVQSKQQEAAGH